MADKSRAEWEGLILQWIHNEEDRRMLVRKLLDGVVFEDLAEEFNLSVSRTKTRVGKAKAQLFQHL